MWDRKELKEKGKAAFKANYWKCVLVGLLLVLFAAGTGASTSRTTVNNMNPANNNGITVVSDGTGTTYVMDNQTAGEIANAIEESAVAAAMQDPAFQVAVRSLFVAAGAVLLVIALVSFCLRLLVFNPLEVGCRGFFTRNTEAPAELNELKKGFHPYGRTVGAMLLRDVFLFLWFLLFVIPGLIKIYSYRMVPYILADDPEIGAKDAITLSRQMMDGHKWNTFVLDLSFIGWNLLSLLTFGLVGVFYANPYQYSTNAELYKVLKKQGK